MDFILLPSYTLYLNHLFLHQYIAPAAAAAAAPAGGAAAPAAKPAEKPKVEEVDALDGGMDMFGGSGGAKDY